MKVKEKLLVQPKDIRPSFKGWEVEGVFNPAVVRLPNKKIMLLARVAEVQDENHRKGLTCPVIISEKEQKVHYQKIEGDQILDQNENMIFLKDGTCRLSTMSHFRKINHCQK